RSTQRLANDVVRLFRILDDADVFHRRFEVARLPDELDAPTANALIRDVLALTRDEDDRRILFRGADGCRRQVGDAGSLVADDDARLTGHARKSIRHERP